MTEQVCARLETRGGQAVNVLSVKLSGDLRGLLFEACVEQRFCNPTDKNIEIVYSFPLPWGAVLLGVDVLLGDQHLTGAVVEKFQAEARYEEALSEGNAAIMLEKNHDRSYSLNLGNLAAGEQCIISLRYAQTLQFEQRGLRLLIPTVLAPRYGDPVRDGRLMPHQAPSHSLVVDYPFELAVRLHGDLAQARISSPSHSLSVIYGKSQAGDVLTASLARIGSLDRDFILSVDQLAHDSLAVIARDRVDAERVAILASFCPRIHTPQSASSAVKILVDCSGSMAGDNIDAAKRALQAIILQLSAQDHFSLSRFGSTVEHRSRGLWKTTKTTQLAAQRWVENLNADMGGTEMEGALTSTFALAHTRPCDVLVVTDGAISAIDSTIETAQNSGHRLFVVGIGSSPVEAHLRRLAEATGGACNFVAPGESVEPAVLRMFARLRSPRLSSLHLEWPAGVTPEWVSPLLPAVFVDDTVNVYALLRQPPAGTVRLLGKLSEKASPQEIGCADLAVEAEAADTLSRMAAAVRLQSTQGDENLIGGAPDAVQLALDYQLVTDQTNFLLVHERQDSDKATDMPEFRKMAQMIPAGWAGTSSIRATRGANYFAQHFSAYHVAERLQWDDSVTPSSPAVMRTRRASSSRNDTIRDSGVPAYLRKRNHIIDRNNPQHWTESEHYSGLTPLGVSECLYLTPEAEWPTTFLGLRQIGLGAWLVDWLELSMTTCDGSTHTEARIVEAFLYLMSRRDTYDALLKAHGFLGTFQSTARRLRGMPDSELVIPSTSLDASLVGALAVALEGMTANAWPERVFALSSLEDEVCMADQSAVLA